MVIVTKQSKQNEENKGKRMKKVALFALSALLLTSYISCEEIQNISDESQLEQIEKLDKDKLSEDELLINLFEDFDTDDSDGENDLIFSGNNKSKISQLKDAIKFFYSLPRDVKKGIAKEVASVLVEHVKSHKIAYGIAGAHTSLLAVTSVASIPVILFLYVHDIRK